MESFLKEILRLTDRHVNHCELYKLLVRNHLRINHLSSTKDIQCLEHVPFFHVSAYKESVLTSIDSSDVFKTLKSSGTTGKQSIIKISREDLIRQNETLFSSYKKHVSEDKRAMLVVDNDPNEIIKKEGYVARVAGIVGFGTFCSSRAYVLDANDRFSDELSDAFLTRRSSSPILLFGMTPQLWKNRHELSELFKRNEHKDIVVLHGGGWKKLEAQSVSRVEFDDVMINEIGASKVVNYYGMVEQLGSVFFTCPNGRYHMHRKARAIARDITTLKPIANQVGVMQLFSTIPESYPGHSILTDDLGIVHTEECGCGDSEQSFTIIGRHSKAIVRGCGNV